MICAGSPCAFWLVIKTFFLNLKVSVWWSLLGLPHNTWHVGKPESYGKLLQDLKEDEHFHFSLFMCQEKLVYAGMISFSIYSVGLVFMKFEGHVSMNSGMKCQYLN